jgi:hypothetical protein
MVTNMDIYGALQPLTGSELIAIYQEQSGQWITCSMPLSVFASFVGSSGSSGPSGSSTAWATTLPTTRPSTSGVVWDNGGVVSIS